MIIASSPPETRHRYESLGDEGEWLTENCVLCEKRSGAGRFDDVFNGHR
jgi:hypothetical protein